MKRKGQRKSRERRSLRRKENARDREHAPDHDSMIGRACRRLWGCGKEK